jgi:NADPH:quinone reductase-like Zn-dependent oxidoreductase
VQRDEQIEELKALGANEVINSNHGELVEKVSDITDGKLAYGAIDCVGGELTKVKTKNPPILS